jgi:cytochrome o ubiquinol oxidase subunit IV
MNTRQHDAKAHSEPPASEHGTIASYIIGFMLSLVSTLIPYYLVVNETVQGKQLLAIIIGFAVLQLVIQVVFFLHLGREKKPRFNLFFLVSTIGIILLVVIGSIWIMNHLHYGMSGKNVTDKIVADEAVYTIGGQQVGTCPGNSGTNYRIELKDGIATPQHTIVKLCDTLTIVNFEGEAREFGFGTPQRPEKYAGESGKTIRPRRSMVLRLTELGTHTFYAQDAPPGSFTVIP